MTDSANFLSTQFLPTFIDAYRNHPCLWLVKSPEYSNKNLKIAAYKDLFQLTKKAVPNCDLNFIKKKIEILRGSFRREDRKVNKSMQAGGGVYTPKLWYYNLLLFLKDQDQEEAGGGQSSLPAGDHVIQDFQEEEEHFVEEDDNGEEDIFEAETMYMAPSPAFGHLKRPRHENEETAAASQSQEHSILSHHLEDEFDKFGAVVAAKLRRMTPLQDIFAEHLIHQVLFNGMMDRLQESSTLQLSHP